MLGKYEENNKENILVRVVIVNDEGRIMEED
jgi:hypothetical protein